MSRLSLFTILCLLNNPVLAQDTSTTSSGSPFDIRDSRNQTWSLPELAKCEAETFLNAEVINAVRRDAIEIDQSIRARFEKTKREALITNGAMTLLLNEMAKRDDGNVVGAARETAAKGAEKLKAEMIDLISTILANKDVDQQAAALAQVTLEFNLSLRDVETSRCSQSLIILTEAYTLLEDPVESVVAVEEGSASEAIAPTEPQSVWHAKIDTSPMTDETRVILMSSSQERVPAAYGDGEYATLILRCAENVTSAYIHFGGAFMSDSQGFGSVDIRIDDQKMRSMSLGVSDNNEALGFFEGGEAIPFIKTLFEGQELRIRAAPYNENSVLLTFPIIGIDREIQPLRETCGW
jgi:type VI secretion system protein VasI